jgi:hypothetical protein
MIMHLYRSKGAPMPNIEKYENLVLDSGGSDEMRKRRGATGSNIGW